MEVAAHSSDDQGRGPDNALTSGNKPPRTYSNAQVARTKDDSNKPNDVLDGTGELSTTIDNTQDADTEMEGADGDAVNSKGDDISIASFEISEMKDRLSELPSDDAFQAIRKVSDKFASVTGLYVKSLEARVGLLEENVSRLQNQKDQRKREGDAHEPSLTGPCHPFRSLQPVRLNMKEFRSNSTMCADDAACIFLGFTSSTDPLQDEQVYGYASHAMQIRKRIVQVAIDDSDVNTVEGTLPRATNLARFYFTSPWFFVVIELLTGQPLADLSIYEWVYPFKYPVAYLEHIKKFVQLLDEIELSLSVDDLLPTLTRVAEQVATSLGSNRSDFTYSTERTERILRMAKYHFHLHFEKAEKRSRADSAKVNTEGETNESHSRDNSGIAHSTTNSSTIAEQKSSRLPCSCLRDARDHLQLLRNVIDEYLSDLLYLQRAISDRSLKKVKFQDLWFLYKPGDLIVTSKQPHQAYRVVHVCGGRSLMTKSAVLHVPSEDYQDQNRKPKVSPFKIDCVRLDFDGENFGPVQATIDIVEFYEERNITDLSVYPMDFAEKKTELRDSLLARGRRFASFQDYKHQKYVGLSLDDPQEEIESEVIIDLVRAFRQYPYSRNRPELGLDGKAWPDVRETYEDRCNGDECMLWCHNRILNDTILDIDRSRRFVNAETDGLLLENAYREKALSEDQLILLPYCVHGFSLRSRKWVSLDIEKLSEKQLSDAPDLQYTAFEDLVIPQEYKKTVKALVKTHALGSENSHQVDLVRGKGKGLIILLHSVPSVGKTSTAECVAAYTKRPLIPITCGDIGQTAQEVEKNLEDIFLLARSWGCVLLLDEADVFLAKRQVDSVERNALVSVFLRTLEYYSGILFLTTNRIGSFDEAFISRIHISLYYPDLNEESTLKVWDMNLGRIKRSGYNIWVSNDDITSFAKSHWKDGHRWNGRQICNAFHTAIALAEYDFREKCNMCEQIGERAPLKPALLPDHFKVVAQTRAEFDNYLRNVYDGSTYKDKAKRAEIRSDDWQDQGTETPSGKKYSTERAKRPGMSLVHEGAKQRSGQVVPKPLVQKEPVRADLTESGAKNVKDDEEFRMWREEKQRKEREKIQRFEMMEKDMEEGR